MLNTSIVLDDDEVIIRVFLRRAEETWGFNKLRNSDFARRMNKESGISMLRLKYLESKDEALNWFKSDKLKGLAVCEGRVLKDLKLQFLAGALEDKHISVRCSGCDLKMDYRTALCMPAVGEKCLIDLQAIDSLSLRLRQSFSIDIPAGFGR